MKSFDREVGIVNHSDIALVTACYTYYIGLLDKYLKNRDGMVCVTLDSLDARQKLEDQMNPNIATDLKHGLVAESPDVPTDKLFVFTRACELMSCQSCEAIMIV